MLRKYADLRAINLFESLYLPEGLTISDNKDLKIDFGKEPENSGNPFDRHFESWVKDKHGFWSQGEFNSKDEKDGRVIKITDYGKILLLRCKNG